MKIRNHKALVSRERLKMHGVSHTGFQFDSAIVHTR